MWFTFDFVHLSLHLILHSICTANINSWRLPAGSADGEQLSVAPFFVQDEESPAFNQLFAGLYDLIFSKLTRTSYLIPSMNRNIRAVFAETVHGRDAATQLDLVSAKTIAYLKWIIFVSAFKDDKSRALLEDVQFYVTQYKTLEAPLNQHWRTYLLDALEIWYRAHPPVTKKRKSNLLEEFIEVEINALPMKAPKRVAPELEVAAAAAAAAAAASAGNEGGGGGGD